MTKASKVTAVVAETTNAVDTAVVEVAAIETVTIELPKGSKVTASKRTIIAPPHAITANKERWFEVKRLSGYSVKDGVISITLPKSALGYRHMINED